MKNSENTPNELIFVGGIDSNLWLDNGKSYLGTLNKDTEFTVVKGLPVLLRQMVEV